MTDLAEDGAAQDGAAQGGSAQGTAAQDGPVLTREIAIVNRRGLHARATAKLVQCVEGFDVAVTVSRDGETVGGTSIMGILTLGAGIGSSIVVTVQGPQAEAALEAITALVANKFGEDE